MVTSTMDDGACVVTVVEILLMIVVDNVAEDGRRCGGATVVVGEGGGAYVYGERHLWDGFGDIFGGKIKVMMNLDMAICHVTLEQVIACPGGKSSGLLVGGPEFEPPDRRDVSPGFTRCCGVSWEAVGSIPAISISKAEWCATSAGWVCPGLPVRAYKEPH
ncbi:hypothetical protein LXL04_032952 [Taraxacum kok-saghyz]